MKISQDQNYNILTSELNHPVTSFNGKIYVCETCHKYLSKNVIPYQTVWNQMETDLISNEFKYLKCLEKTLISKIFCFKQ